MDPSSLQDAVNELHAASYAVVLLTQCRALTDCCDTFWVRTLDRYYLDPALMQQLDAHLADMKVRAERQAKEMRDSLPGQMLRLLCDDQRLKQ